MYENETYFISTANTTPNVVVAGGTLPIGTVTRRFDKKTKCGVRRFEVEGNSISAQVTGFYSGYALVTFTAPVAGDVTISVLANGTPIVGATATETITTATTETRTVTIPFKFPVSKTCVGGILTTLSQNISVTTSLGITATNFVLALETI